MAIITQLKETEVFTFGSNAQGFHGAGSAGFAFHGDKGNSWRTNPQFQKAYKAFQAKEKGQPYDPEDLKGNWAVLGETGLMHGKKGMSYGIITTEAPGKQGGVNSQVLQEEMEKLIDCAFKNPELTFLCVNFGLSRAHGGFSWWSPTELQTLWEKAKTSCGGLPPNLQEPDWAKAKEKATAPHREPQPNQPTRGNWASPSSPDLEM